MKKNYIIRQIAYGYDDQSCYSIRLGGIASDAYHDYEQAYQNLLQLERIEYLRYRMIINDYHPFSGLEMHEPTENMLQLKHFLEVSLGLDAFQVLDNGLLMAQNDLWLPEELTVEQVHHIRTLSGLKFYEIVVLDDHEPQFYGIWQRKPFWEYTGFKMVYEGEVESVIFYATYDEALAAATNDISEIHDTTIKKSLKALSDMPIVLKAMIDHSKNMDYNEATKVLTIRRITPNEWVQFCALLKKKPFEVRQMPFEIAKSAEHWVFEIEYM
jgi:hypothetical protein